MAVPTSNPSYISASDEGAGVNVLSNTSEVLVAASATPSAAYVEY